MVEVLIEPGNEKKVFPKLNTVRQLLSKLDLRVNDALIIRGDHLLTPDRKIKPGDTIIVRLVASRG
jgi:sulfur carrier protein